MHFTQCRKSRCKCCWCDVVLGVKNAERQETIMKIYISEKIKQLRTERGISQEKLAQYLNVSYQAVSKWENGNTYPDISLLPEIACFFGVTVDELLQVEKIDEEKLYNEYEAKACELFRNGKVGDTLELWREAHQKLPNNMGVKEMLMSTYFDIDKVKYKNEIIELGTEIYNATLAPVKWGSYYRGQAISEIARTYAANDDEKMAEEWASKASMLHHSQEFIYSEFVHGKELLDNFTFTNHWYFCHLYYMACHISEDEELARDGYAKEVFETVARLYEAVYPNDDMEYESLRNLYFLHLYAVEEELSGAGDEEIVRAHLTRAQECAKKSTGIKSHTLEHPLMKGWEIMGTPSDNLCMVRKLEHELNNSCYDRYRDKEWFVQMKTAVDK